MYRLTRPIVLLLFGLTITPALADKQQDGRWDIPKPPARMPMPHMVQATYLGVTAESVSPAMNSQLNLPKGLGLVVTHVVPDGPAAKAGLQKHDVLRKLDDQLLVNFDQFAVLIRLYEPDDSVTLSVIRAGEAIEVVSTLVTHEVSELPSGPRGMPGMWHNQRFTRTFADGVPPMPVFDLQEVHSKIRGSLPDPLLGPGAPWTIGSKDKFKIRVKDAEHTIHIDTMDPDVMRLKIQDADGKVLHDGPWDPATTPLTSDLPKRVIQKIQTIIGDPKLGGPVRIQADEVEVFHAPPVQDAN